MPDMKTYPVQKSDEEWRRILTPEQYAVLRGHATEQRGSCALLHEHRAGTFTCAGCGQRLFVADRKFESHTGWPSFFAPLEGAIGSTVDRSYGMTRTEVHCSRCGGHLGHVFDDGPPPTGLRYCINGVALNFEPADYRNRHLQSAICNLQSTIPRPAPSSHSHPPPARSAGC